MALYKARYGQDLTYLEDLIGQFQKLERSTHDYDRDLEAFNLAIEYLVEETKTDDVYAVRLPTIGTIYNNRSMMMHEKRGATTEEKRSFWEGRIGNLEWYRNEVNNSALQTMNNPVIIYSRALPKSHRASEIKGLKRPIEEVYATIEEIQNKHYRGYYERSQNG